MGLVSFFCMWISNFPSTVYWRDCPFSTEYSCLSCQISVDRFCMGLFLSSPFCSIGLCVYTYASTMLFWWLWLWNIAWNQEVWFLLLCSFSELFWLSGVFCGSIWILGLFNLLLKKCHWNLYRNCIESIDGFW